MLIKKEERYRLVGAAMEVHRTLGCGFSEFVYQDALAVELEIRGIPFEREKYFEVTYKNKLLKHTYKADFVCFGDIVVECKATSAIAPEHEAQTLNYMHASKCPVGICINFGTTSLDSRQYVLEQYYTGPKDSEPLNQS